MFHIQGRHDGTMQDSSLYMKGKEYRSLLRHFGRGGGCGEGIPGGKFLLGTGGGRSGLTPVCEIDGALMPGGGAGGATPGGRAGGGYRGGPPTGVTGVTVP